MKYIEEFVKYIYVCINTKQYIYIYTRLGLNIIENYSIRCPYPSSQHTLKGNAEQIPWHIYYL